MHRLFVAVDLPDKVRDSLAGMCGGIPEARWVTREQLHLTLRFIGEVNNDTFTTIRESLARMEADSFPLAVEGIGHFPPGKHPRVLWVGLSTSDGLVTLQTRIEETVTNSGVPRESRRFSPHITLARLKDPSPEKVELFETRHRDLRTDPFPITEFHLYSSTLSNKGAVHRRERTYPLRRPLTTSLNT